MSPSPTEVSRRVFLGGLAGGAVAGVGTVAASPAAAGTPRPWALPRRPNIILIQADDLGYGELGCYGQRRIRTPHIDALAASGQRFTQNYCSAPLCSPSRYSLLTGMHTGHAAIRDNSGTVPPEDVTVADVLRTAGYATTLIGKWGLGGSPGASTWPTGKGFDEFYGYATNTAAHDYFPSELWRGEERVSIPENAGDARVTFAPDLLGEACLDFVQRHRHRPFFLYYNPNIPHAPNIAPTQAPYDLEPWPEGEKYHAAQITRMDSHIGRLMELLERLDLDDNTIVMFTSDNGPHEEGGQGEYERWGSVPFDPGFFDSRGGLRGIKRNLYEGGVRSPMIVRTPLPVIARLRATHGEPGILPPRIRGSVSRQVWTHWDLLPTLAAIAGVAAPDGIDGISFLPTLIGLRQQEQHEYLYWETHSAPAAANYPVTAAANAPADPTARPVQAIRKGDWKAVRREFRSPIELYDLASDPAETTDVAHHRHDVVSTMAALFASARTPYRGDSPPVTTQVRAEPPTVEPGGTSEVTIAIANARDDAFEGTVSVPPPDGWWVEPASRPVALDAAVGAQQDVVFTITAPAEPTNGIITYVVESQDTVVATGTIPLAGANLARTATATASSTHPNWRPDGAIDGVRSQGAWPDTGWNDGTSGSFPDWFQLTWPEAQVVDTVELVTRPTGRGVTDYDVQVLTGSDWTTVAAVRGNTAEVIRTRFPAVTATALRIHITASASGDYSRIVELEVYGP